MVGGARVMTWRGFGGRRWSARGLAVVVAVEWGGTSGRGGGAGGGRGARVRTMLRTALGWVKLQVSEIDGGDGLVGSACSKR